MKKCHSDDPHCQWPECRNRCSPSRWRREVNLFTEEFVKGLGQGLGILTILAIAIAYLKWRAG